MGQELLHTATSSADRAAEAQKATWVSVVVNLVMTIAQLIIGWLTPSRWSRMGCIHFPTCCLIFW